MIAVQQPLFGDREIRRLIDPLIRSGLCKDRATDDVSQSGLFGLLHNLRIGDLLVTYFGAELANGDLFTADGRGNLTGRRLRRAVPDERQLAGAEHACRKHDG